MTGTLLWLLVLAAVSLGAAIALRRVSALAGDTHELERFQADVVAIHQRLSETVDPLVVRLDEVRRGALDPAEAVADVSAVRAALRALSQQARRLSPPPALADRSQQLTGEVDRAVRAADMAGHGLDQLGRDRRDIGTEAQTALKRGTLGLRHAREAVARIMIGVARLTPAEIRAMPPAPILPAIAAAPPDDDLLAGAEETTTP